MTIKAVYHDKGVYIRITQNRKHKYKKLLSIEKEFWNGTNIKPKHPRHHHLNKEIADAVKEYQDKAILVKEIPNHKQLEKILGKAKSPKTLSKAITQYSNLVRKEGKYNAARKYRNAADKVEEFKDVDLVSVDQKYLRDFHQYLKDRGRGKDGLKSKQLSTSTIHRDFKFLKTVIRYESNEDPSVNRAILNYKVPNEEAPRDKLTREEFELIAHKELDNKLSLSRDVFCALVYSWGSRIGDVLQMQPKHIMEDRLEFKEQKTGKLKSVKIGPELKEIIDHYKHKSTHYIFPLLTKPPVNPRENPDYQKHIESKTSVINKDLKLIAAKCGIEKRITTHVARHTFAVWASKKEVPLHLIQEMLNHSSKSVTENYLKSLNKSDNLDEAAASVFG